MKAVERIAYITLFALVYMFSCQTKNMKITSLESQLLQKEVLTDEHDVYEYEYQDLLRACEHLDLVLEYETGLCVTMDEWKLMHDEE